MSDFSLKKLVKKENVVRIIEELQQELNSELLILDVAGVILFGSQSDNQLCKFPVSVDGEDIGWVCGDGKASLVASILSQISNDDYEKRKLMKETLDKYREILLLYEISEKITSCLDLNEVAKLVINEATRLIDSTNASVMVINQEEQSLEKIASNDVESIHKSLGTRDGIIQSVLIKGVGEIINDVKSDTRNGACLTEIKSMICTPLKIKDRIIGILELESLEAANYTAEDLKLLNSVAVQAAVAIENANLYDALKETFFETVQSLVETIEKKDPYTAGHARRVAKYSVAIGEELGLSKAEVLKIKLAALLHDIGKVGIEDGVLLKNGKLSDEEYSIIKKHSVYGAEIVSNIKQLKDIVPSVRAHHERYDGKGYPDGIKEKDIPLIARILAVADTFDAMTSNRVYRPKLDVEYALLELTKHENYQFDPQMVKAFLKAYKNISPE